MKKVTSRSTMDVILISPVFWINNKDSIRWLINSYLEMRYVTCWFAAQSEESAKRAQVKTLQRGNQKVRLFDVITIFLRIVECELSVIFLRNVGNRSYFPR